MSRPSAMGSDSIGDCRLEPAPPVAPESDQAIEDEVGDFISGHVLEKDTVFFEG